MLARSLVVVSCALLFACSGASSSGLFENDSPGTIPQANDGGPKNVTPPKKERDGGADAAAATDAGAKPGATCALTNLQFPKENVCYECWAGACCADWKTCDGNPSCVKLAVCVSNCTAEDPDCFEDCAFLYPNGTQTMNVLIACAQKSCSTQCK